MSQMAHYSLFSALYKEQGAIWDVGCVKQGSEGKEPAAMEPIVVAYGYRTGSLHGTHTAFYMKYAVRLFPLCGSVPRCHQAEIGERIGISSPGW